MKKLKEMMKGYKRRIIGKYVVTKELAHTFDVELNEHFCYIYNIEKI